MRARIVIAVLAVALSVAATAWGACRLYSMSRAGLRYQQSRGPSGIDLGEEQRVFDVGSATRVVIDNETGDVQVVAGGPRVTLRAHSYAWGGSGLVSQRTPTLAGSVAGGELRIATRARRGSQTRTDIVLAAPPGIAVLIRLRVGNVTVDGRTSSVAVEGGFGDIQVANCKGPVTVDSSAGNVEVNHARERVAVSLGVGDITLKDVTSPLEVHSRAGTITIAGATSGRIAASVGCGDVDVEMAEPFSGELKAHAGAGTVAIALKPGSRCRVDTQVGLGSVSDGLPTRVIARTEPGLIEAGARLGDVTLTEAL